MDLGFQLKMAMRTGKVNIGFRTSEKSVMNGRAKLVIVASNAPERIRKRMEVLAKAFNVPLYVFEGTSLELGELIGRPHFVAVIAVEDPGESSILEIVKEVAG